MPIDSFDLTTTNVDAAQIGVIILIVLFVCAVGFFSTRFKNSILRNWVKTGFVLAALTTIVAGSIIANNSPTSAASKMVVAEKQLRDTIEQEYDFKITDEDYTILTTMDGRDENSLFMEHKSILTETASFKKYGTITVIDPNNKAVVNEVTLIKDKQFMYVVYTDTLGFNTPYVVYGEKKEVK